MKFKLKLSAPTRPVFLIAVVGGLLGFIFSLGVLGGASPVIGALVQLAALVLLALGCLIKKL